MTREQDLGVEADKLFAARYAELHRVCLDELSSLTGRAPTNEMFTPLNAALATMRDEVKKAHRARHIAMGMFEEDMRNHGQPGGQST